MDQQNQSADGRFDRLLKAMTEGEPHKAEKRPTKPEVEEGSRENPQESR